MVETTMTTTGKNAKIVWNETIYPSIHSSVHQSIYLSIYFV